MSAIRVGGMMEDQGTMDTVFFSSAGKVEAPARCAAVGLFDSARISIHRRNMVFYEEAGQATRSQAIMKRTWNAGE